MTLLLRLLACAALAGTLAPVLQPSAPAPALPAGAPVEALILRHLENIERPWPTPEEGKAASEATLAGLRRHAAEAAVRLERAYDGLPEDAAWTRFAMVAILADLRSEEASAALRRIARSEVPPERYKDTHLESSRMDELMIRALAMDGLAVLARQGSAASEAALLEAALDPAAPSVSRERAIIGYVRAGADMKARAARLAGRIPEDSAWALSPYTVSREALDRESRKVGARMVRR